MTQYDVSYSHSIGKEANFEKPKSAATKSAATKVAKLGLQAWLRESEWDNATTHCPTLKKFKLLKNKVMGQITKYNQFSETGRMV